jgi:hypothetical protein
MQHTSPFLAMQEVERQLKALLRSIDIDAIDQQERKAVANIRRLSADARIDIRDYELSETRDEQIRKMHQAQRKLARLVASILSIGFVFGPADVAQMTAQLEYIQSQLI